MVVHHSADFALGLLKPYRNVLSVAIVASVRARSRFAIENALGPTSIFALPLRKIQFCLIPKSSIT